MATKTKNEILDIKTVAGEGISLEAIGNSEVKITTSSGTEVTMGRQSVLDLIAFLERSDRD